MRPGCSSNEKGAIEPKKLLLGGYSEERNGLERAPRLGVPGASDLLTSLARKEKNVKNPISVFLASFSPQVSVMMRLTQHCASHAGVCKWAYPLYNLHRLFSPSFCAQVCSPPSRVSSPSLVPTRAFHIPQTYFYLSFFSSFFFSTLSSHQSIAIRKDH